MTNPISEERLRNTRAWAAARVGSLSGADVIVGVIDELIALRESFAARMAMVDTPLEPSGDGWQPISRVPNGDEVRMFWVRPKRPEESYVNSSGQPVVSGGEPHIHIGKYLSWSSLSTATHWRPMPGPPSENRTCKP